MEEYLLHILVITGIYVILTVSLNLILGYTGLPAFGHAAFSCVGAYTSSLLALQYGISPWSGLILGACLAAALGFIIGLPSIRLKGDYLALATFGAAVIVYSVAKNWVSLTRGPLGLPGIPGFSLLGFALNSIVSYLILVAIFVLFTYAVIWRIVKSHFGRVVRAVREDEIAE
ncbi:MAG: branched-chain amino acid ABC transporter permease, partial [Candidatus Margulisiibacteriota bacterium]